MNINPDTYRDTAQLSNKGQRDRMFKTKPRDKRTGSLRWNFIFITNIDWMDCRHFCISWQSSVVWLQSQTEAIRLLSVGVAKLQEVCNRPHSAHD